MSREPGAVAAMSHGRDQVRLGVVGLGTVAQAVHLPPLAVFRERIVRRLATGRGIDLGGGAARA